MQVYSNLLDLTFNVPEALFHVKQPTDILDRHTLDLFIDGLWETTGDEKEGCDSEGISYEYVPGVHTALHGQDGSEDGKPMQKDVQSKSAETGHSSPARGDGTGRKSSSFLRENSRGG